MFDFLKKSTNNPAVWLERAYAGLFLLLPWSVEWPFGASTLLFPAEPLLAVTGLGLFFAWRKTGFKLDKPNALIWIVPAWALWLTVSAAGSVLPLVSWKYWLVEMAHLWVFGFGMFLFPDLWRRVFPFFAWSLAAMAVYALARHGVLFHFRVDQALLASMPFFSDHTVWGAVLGLTVFALGAWHWHSGARQRGIGMLLLFSVALFFTFSRAAWLSTGIAGLLGLSLVFSKKRRWALPGLLASGLIAGFFFWKPVAAALAADVSAQERLNRYSCAARMAADRPWAGFGPGTFAFEYLAYQKPEQRTRISMTAPVERRAPGNYGRGGGAHSEYFQAWAELGWPGLALWTALVAGVLASGFRNFRIAETKENQWFALLTTLGLLAFFLHGLVNNFLHDARAAALVWGQAGVILSWRR